MSPIAEPPEPAEPEDSGEVPPLAGLAPPRAASADTHAAGTPGGGTAVGGLAATTIGDGDPAATDLDDAMGSGAFDAELPAEDPHAYVGPAGGAVGGRKRCGLAPQRRPGHGSIGP
jgi:hypothetical protein